MKDKNIDSHEGQRLLQSPAGMAQGWKQSFLGRNVTVLEMTKKKLVSRFMIDYGHL